MDDETKKIIETQLKSLPKTIQDAILNSGWEKKTHALAKKYNLHIDQEGTLVSETFLVMLGLELVRDFNQNLVTNLGISKIIASQIEGDLSEQIFKPIRTELQKVNDKIVEEESNATPQTDLAKNILGGTENPKTDTAEDDLDRDVILREIETPGTSPSSVSKISIPPTAKPSPIAGPVTKTTTEPSVPAKVPAQPVSTPIKTTTVSTQVEPMPSVSVMPKTPNMVDSKLKNIVKTEKTPSYTPPASNTPATKPIDPYREPAI